MSKSLKIEFTCPDCETTIKTGAEVCPGCGLELEWDEEDTAIETDVEKIIDGLTTATSLEGEVDGPEGIVPDVSEDGKDSESTSETGEEPYDPTVKDEPGSEESKWEESDKEPGIVEVVDMPELSENHDAGEAEKEEADEDIEGPIPTQGKRPKVYAKIFTTIGLFCIVLTVLSVMALVVLYQWDIWISGSSESSLGERQMTAIYATLILLFVFLIITLADIYQIKRTAKA